MSQSARTPSSPEHRYLRPPVPLYFPSDDPMPETGVHLLIRTGLFLVLRHELRGRAFVGSEQFVYWDPTDPKACLAPDIAVRLGGPAGPLSSFKVWEHGAPHLAVEIVSPSDASDRDWDAKLQRYRRCGVAEVVRFDPEADALPLRLWDLVEGDLVERDPMEPASRRSNVLEAYFCVRADIELGRVLRVSRDPEGEDLWLSPEEAALARVAELEAELRRHR